MNKEIIHLVDHSSVPGSYCMGCIPQPTPEQKEGGKLPPPSVADWRKMHEKFVRDLVDWVEENSHIADARKMSEQKECEQYACPSYYDGNSDTVKDCLCGKCKLRHPTSETLEGWEKDFYKEFEDAIDENRHICELDSRIIDFIRQTLKSQQERLRGQVKSVDFKELHACAFNDGGQDCECYLAAREHILKLLQ